MIIARQPKIFTLVISMQRVHVARRFKEVEQRLITFLQRNCSQLLKDKLVSGLLEALDVHVERHVVEN